MTKHTKLFLITALTLFALIPGANAQSTSPKPIVIPNVRGHYVEPKDVCVGHVLVTLNGVQYTLPRIRSMEFRPTETTVIDKNTPGHPAFDCQVNDMGTVVGFETGFYSKDDIDIELIAPGIKTKKGFTPATNYRRYKDAISSAKKDNASLMFEGGMQKFGWKTNQVYTLPQGTSPTKNDEPAAIRCLLDKEGSKSGMCNASYILPSGEFISYSFAKAFFSEVNYPKIDQQVRARIEKLKVKVKQPQ